MSKEVQQEIDKQIIDKKTADNPLYNVEDSNVLLGHKGSLSLDTGIICYAPYIPLIITSQIASSNDYGFTITVENDGVNRYTYDPNRDGDLAAIDDIEQKGLIILDENEEECWIDVIDPNRLAENVNQDILAVRMSKKVQQEIDGQIVGKIMKAMIKNHK